MLQVKDLTELKVDDLWQEVKWDQEYWWCHIKQETIGIAPSWHRIQPAGKSGREM